MPIRYELFINVRSAKALGLKIPPVLCGGASDPN